MMRWQCTLDLSLSLSLMMYYAITHYQRQRQTYDHNLWLCGANLKQYQAKGDKLSKTLAT